jgi:DNA-damage-inducible protein J
MADIIKARIEPELKSEATKVLNSLGLTPSAAIRIFFQQVVSEQGLPFPVKRPNAATRTAMEDIENDRNLTSHKTLPDLWKDLDSGT